MPKKILIADDEPAIREILSIYAELYGYDVVTATDGIDLLNIVSNEHFDAVITDLMMTELDGAAATEIMKLQGLTVPVFALTGMTPEQLTQVRDSFTCIYHKPCDFNNLFNQISKLIS